MAHRRWSRPGESVEIDAMKLSKVPKILPGRGSSSKGAPADEQYVWTQLVPRLLHPSKLTIIQALLREGQPLSPATFAEAAKITVKHARYHCTAMERAGVIEVVTVTARPDGDDEPSYFFRRSAPADSSSATSEASQ